MKTKFISVDFQNDFALKGGVHYRRRPCVDFIKKTLVPHFMKKGIKVAEIVSDYRLPRHKKSRSSCAPGTWGFESGIPREIKKKDVRIKSDNSPVWTRKNAGVPGKKPGLPYPDPKGFKKWLEKNVGKPGEVDEVILFGLTADCCVFSTAQELKFLGYSVRVLKEATDTYTGSQKEKKMILENYPLRNWAGWTTWAEVKKLKV